VTTPTEQHDIARTIELDGRRVPAGNPDAAGVSYFAPGDHPPEADPETGELPWDGFKDGRIQNFLGLDWAARKMEEYERGVAQNEACLAEFTQRVEEKVAEVRAKLMGRAVERTAELNAPLRTKAAFFRSAVVSFAREQGRKAICIGSAKSRGLPSSDVVLKWRVREEGEYRYDQRPGPNGEPPTPAENQAALLAWCAKEEDVTGETLTKPNPVPDLDEIKRHLAAFKAQGEPLDCPPGLEWVEPGETLSVTTKGESK
jgi:hypothetical protein